MCASSVNCKSQTCANSSGGQSPACHHGDSVSIPGTSVWDLWWTKRICDSSLTYQQFSAHTNRTKLLYLQKRKRFWNSESVGQKVFVWTRHERALHIVEKLGFYHCYISWLKTCLVIPVPIYTSLCFQYQVRKWQTFGTNAYWGAPQIVTFQKLLIRLTDTIIFFRGGGLWHLSEF